MSRLFNDTFSEFAVINSAVVTAVPITMACWFYWDDDSANDVLMFVGDKDVDDNYWALELRGGDAGDPVAAVTRTEVARVQSASATGPSLNVWNHGAAVFSANDNRLAYLNGTAGTAETTSNTPTGVDRMSLGYLGRASPVDFMSGRIAEAAMWSAALFADEIAALAKGFPPYLIRPTSLEAYWPLFGYASPEIDIVGGFNLTLTGTAKAEHCRMIHRPVFDTAVGEGVPPETAAIVDPSFAQFPKHKLRAA